MPIRALSLACLLAFAACGESQPASKIPADLEAVESAAEDTFDTILAADFATARGQADTIASAWAVYKPRAQTDGAPAVAVTAVDSSVAALPTALAGTPDRIAAGRAANRVSEPMAQLYAIYEPVIPTSVLDLDYLGRELLLDALGADQVLAQQHVDRIAAIWMQLRPEVIAAGSKREHTDFDGMLAAARSAVAACNPVDLEAAARAELEVVDSIEAVFSAAADVGD